MGNVIGYLTYDGKDSRDFGVIVSSVGTHNAPKRVVEEVAIPGRNGTLTIDGGRFENITISYIAMIMRDFPKRFDEFKAFLMSHKGYKRLEDSFSPEYYRLAKIHDEINPSVVTWDAAGKFEIPFDCDPRRFLKDGEEPIAIDGTDTVYNPTYFDAKPLLRINIVNPLMPCNVVINGKTIGIDATVSSHIVIDLETMNAYNGSINMNDKVSIPDGVALKPGDNIITVGSNIGELTITPRWWTV